MIKYGLLFFTLLLVSSCSTNPCGHTKEEFLSNYNEYLDELKSKDLHYTDAEWKEQEQKLNNFVEHCYKNHEADLSLQDKQSFWVQTVSFYYKRYGASIANELLDKNNTSFKGLRTYLSEIDRDPNLALQKFIGKFGGKEMKSLLNEISGDVKKWGKKLEKILKID